MNSEVFDQKYKQLNKAQKEAVDTIYGPVMVIAGPGTGKTTVLTLRVANILKLTDTKPDEILAITYTDAGAKAMRKKLREIIGDASFRVNIHTFHSFANFMRASYPECFGRIGGRILCVEIDQVEIIEKIFNRESFRELRISQFGVSVKKVLSRISELKRELITPEKLLQMIEQEAQSIKSEKDVVEKWTKKQEAAVQSKERYIVRMREFVNMFDLYEKELEAREFFDYDDIILGLIDALEENKEMVFEMRERFQFVLADEHQDANGAQNRILQFFHDKSFDEDPNIFVVGDDKQSIFRFQGASLENFFAFREQFKSAKKIDLEENYRSHSAILDASHSMISQDGGNHTKLKALSAHPVTSLDVVEFETEREELQGIAELVADKLKIKSKETIAVLARNNGTLFALAPFLDALNVSYALKGEISLFDTLEYKKIHTLLLALNDPLISGALAETLFFGFFEVPMRDLLVIQDKAVKSRQSFGAVFLGKLDNLELQEMNATENLQKKIINLFNHSKQKPLLEFLKILKEEIILSDKSELFEVLKALFEEAEHVVMRYRNALLPDLIHHLRLIETHRASPMSQLSQNDERVTLLSIHKSKGLEFDFVFIAGVTSKNFEEGSRTNNLLKIPGIGVDKELAEERRLLYVAITRAKQHVTLSFALSNLNDASGSPSALLEEIDPSFINRQKGNIQSVISPINTQLKNKLDLSILRDRFLQRNFSVSALNNYLECPYKYLFRNLLQIPDIKEFNALLGTACHETLKRFHLQKKKRDDVTEKQIISVIDEEVQKLPFTQKDLEIALEKAKEYVLTYARGFENFKKGNDVFVEESLSFDLSLSVGGENVSVPVSGKIDLAVREEAQVSVIDFKSKQRMTQNAIKGLTSSDDGNEYRQLQFYKFLWKESTGKDEVRVGVLTFLSPSNGQVLSENFNLEKSDFDQIKDLTIKTLEEIYSGKFLEKRCEDKHCEYCRLADLVRI